MSPELPDRSRRNGAELWWSGKKWSGHATHWKRFRSGCNAVRIPAAAKFLSLLDEFAPSAVVIRERLIGRTAKKPKLLSIIETQVDRRRIPLRFITPRDVNRAFVGFEKQQVPSCVNLG
jgi:hypothetical protein